MMMVQVMSTANFWKRVTEARNRKMPEPRVVMLPPRIVPPISKYESYILFARCLQPEWM